MGALDLGLRGVQPVMEHVGGLFSPICPGLGGFPACLGPIRPISLHPDGLLGLIFPGLRLFRPDFRSICVLSAWSARLSAAARAISNVLIAREISTPLGMDDGMSCAWYRIYGYPMTPTIPVARRPAWCHGCPSAAATSSEAPA
jgi:hypothetical protein